MATFAQNINTIIVDERANGQNLYDYLSSIEEEYSVDFIMYQAIVTTFNYWRYPKTNLYVFLFGILCWSLTI